MLNLKEKVYKALLKNKLYISKKDISYLIEEDIYNREKLIKKHWMKLIKLLGIRLYNTKHTVDNLTRLYDKEMFIGDDYMKFPKIELIENIFKIRDQIIFRDINFTSICENHMIIFDGYITISYIPQDSLLSLTDINRIIFFYSRRPQTQYKLAQQIKITLETILSTKSLAIYIEANHFCIKFRNFLKKNINKSNLFTSGNFSTNKKLIYDIFIQNNKQVI